LLREKVYSLYKFQQTVIQTKIATESRKISSDACSSIY